MKSSRLRGKTAVVLPMSSPHRVGLLASRSLVIILTILSKLLTITVTGLLYIDKKGSEMKSSMLQGKTAVVLPMSSPHRVGLLAGRSLVIILTILSKLLTRTVTGLLYIDKKGSEMKSSMLQGKTAVVLPMSSPHRVGLLAGRSLVIILTIEGIPVKRQKQKAKAGICWTKSQSPRYPPGLGGAVVTND